VAASPGCDDAGLVGEYHRLRAVAHRYELAPAAGGSEVTASVSRRGGGITGRIVSQATAALLSAGALDGAARSIARAAETAPAVA
jgi:hypothetical protein